MMKLKEEKCCYGERTGLCWSIWELISPPGEMKEWSLSASALLKICSYSGNFDKLLWGVAEDGNFWINVTPG